MIPKTSATANPEGVDDGNALGIDRKHLLELRRRFLRVNRLRLDRTRAALNHRQSLILDLLPLLFHVNHPLLPGYTSHLSPCGLSGYKPDKQILREARRLARSFRYQPLGSRQQAIHGIYVMGSVGTIGQSRSSDLDIWVCHTSDLKTSALEELRAKCQRITEWCEQFNLEVCFFPMDVEKFSRGDTVPLSEESSGSAQHGLLLDEFYRSAIYLGGRYPLWWFVPAQEEHQYQAYTRELLDKRFLRASEVIDLGMPRVPPSEYITAAIWQLYKGIYSPYKSLLKLMLLETYAAHYPNTLLLSSLFKARVQKGATDINRLDPYLLTYETIERHLRTEQGRRRLELVRRCLYFKVDKPLSRRPATSPPSWQREELQALVSSWGWDNQRIQHLDQRRQWKTAVVARERQQLVNELLHSYRQLSGFVRSSNLSLRSIQQEITILGRKLYAAFERKSGKIDWINPDISPDLSETYLTLQQRGQADKSQWLLTDQPPTATAERQHASHLRHGYSPLELVAWSYCNGILAEQTHSWLQTSDRQVYKLNKLYKSFRQWLPLPLKTAEHSAFNRKPHALSLLLVINLLEPSHQESIGGELELDPLNVGRDHISLVNDAHIIVQNSWNEVFVQSFEKLGLEALITEYLRQIPKDRKSPAPRLTIFCREGNLALQLQRRLEQLVQQLQHIFVLAADPHAARFVLCNNGHFSSWELQNGLPVSQTLGDEEQLFNYLSQPRPRLQRICFDQHTLTRHPLAALARLPPSTAIQVAYRQVETEAEILVLDEKGSLFQCRSSFHDEATLLRPLHQFLRNVIDRQNLGASGEGFIGVYPVEFYRLQRDSETRRFEPQTVPVTRDIRDLDFFSIQVIVEVDPFEQLHYAIYCGDLEFHEAEHGIHLFRQVAACVLAQRSNGERYPCYITDLDLSLCGEHIAANQPLQTIHYLRIKYEVERRLNLELMQL